MQTTANGPTVAIIGRPNVGKSTLFNRLVGRKLALVDDQPGVTRDLREGQARLGGLQFRVVDTAGLEDVGGDSLPARMRALTERAIAEADICLFLIDARADLTSVDREVATLLHRSGRSVVVAANKCEGAAGQGGLIEAYDLGFGTVIPMSAEHGEGMDDLRIEFARLFKALPKKGQPDDVDEDDERPIRIAVVGRPNAGKSTLVNAIVGDDRLLTGPEAGITRDAIALDFNWDGMSVRLFDTAGIRKRARVQDRVEKMSVSDGLRAVRFAEVVVILLDQASSFDTQDLRLADLAEREGRGVIVAVNKWDLVTDKSAHLKEIRLRFEELLPQLRGAPLVTVSAATGRGLDRLQKAVATAYAAWNTRVPTARLNTWLDAMITRHPPPAPGGRRIRIRYLTQVKARPPSFVAFCSRPDALPTDYTRYLVNGLREEFNLAGSPIRMSYRKSENPYAPRKSRKIR